MASRMWCCFVILSLASPALAGGKKFCSATAGEAYDACLASVRDDFNVAQGVCLNISDANERSGCNDDAKETRRDDQQSCKDQLRSRRDVCKALGEDRYEPDFDPALFDSDFHHLTHANRYFPVTIGYRWVYRSGSERDVVEVLDATKNVDGVTCIVSHDVVTDGGDLVEDTNDWFAQAKNGDVYYCGEEAKQYQSFDGDQPRAPELVGNEGSFKAGRDGDQTGILFLAAPAAGDFYRQEFSLDNAEDVAQVLSTGYAFGSDPTLDEGVPKALADLFCAGDCVVTREFSPLDAPGGVERKYYAPGIGDFLEIDVDSGEVTQLVDCNFDVRCAMLPAP